MKKPLLFALFSLFMPLAPVLAQDWALDGFDPVGYQSEGRAMPGRTDITTMWKGMIWHFTSVENRARFEADPRAYAPGLNGFSPVSLADGRREPGDPQHFAIIGERVYFLRSGEDQRRFMQDPRGILMEARKVWALFQ